MGKFSMLGEAAHMIKESNDSHADIMVKGAQITSHNFWPSFGQKECTYVFGLN